MEARLLRMLPQPCKEPGLSQPAGEAVTGRTANVSWSIAPANVQANERGHLKPFGRREDSRRLQLHE